MFIRPALLLVLEIALRYLVIVSAAGATYAQYALFMLLT